MVCHYWLPGLLLLCQLVASESCELGGVAVIEAVVTGPFISIMTAERARLAACPA